MYPFDDEDDPYGVNSYNYSSMDPYDINNMHKQNQFSAFGQSPDFGYNDPSDATANVEGGYNPWNPISPFGQLPGYQSRLPSAPAPPVPTPKTSEPIDYYKRARDMAEATYTPSTRASDRLNQLLDNPPQMNNPSFGRKLIASAAAWKGGPEVADKILYAPYAAAKEQFQTRQGPYQSAATLENQQNINERTLTTQMANQAVAQQRADDTARAASEKGETERYKAESDRYRSLAVKYKAEHPNWTFSSKDTTTIIAQDPSTGKQYDTGIPTIHMDEATKAYLQSDTQLGVAGIGAESRENVAGINAQAAAQREDSRQRGQLEMERMREQAALTLKQTQGAAPNTAKEENAARSNMLRDLYIRHPEYHEYIKRNSDGTFDIAPEPHHYTWSPAANAKNVQGYNEFVEDFLGPTGSVTDPGNIGASGGRQQQAPGSNYRPNTQYPQRPGGGGQQQQPPSEEIPQVNTGFPASRQQPSPQGAAYPTPGSPGIRRRPDGSLSGISFFGQPPAAGQQPARMPQQGAAPQVPQEAAPQAPQAANPWGVPPGLSKIGAMFGIGGGQQPQQAPPQQAPVQPPVGGMEGPTPSILPGSPEWMQIWGTSPVNTQQPAFGGPSAWGAQPGTMGQAPPGSIPNTGFGNAPQRPDAPWVTAVKNVFTQAASPEQQRAMAGGQQVQQGLNIDEQQRQVELTQKAIDWLRANNPNMPLDPQNIKLVIMKGYVR